MDMLMIDPNNEKNVVATTRVAFERVWKKKGWKEAKGKDAEPTPENVAAREIEEKPKKS